MCVNQNTFYPIQARHQEIFTSKEHILQETILQALLELEK
jgi:hypothetical protein